MSSFYPQGESDAGGRVSQDCPHGGKFSLFAGFDTLHDEGTGAFLARDEIVFEKPSRTLRTVKSSVAKVDA